QRLSASSEFSLTELLTPCTPLQVLNAFRHHRNSHSQRTLVALSLSRCSTPFGIIGILTFVAWHRTIRPFLCSTPFGIIGILTRSAGRCLSRIRVLNAFRHHRNSHTQQHQKAKQESAVLNAFRHHRNSHGVVHGDFLGAKAGAQLLSASSEFSQALLLSLFLSLICAQRLSASSEFSLSLYGINLLCLLCAQRLSASSEFSLVLRRVVA
ncbi:MAG: hypothetical protein JWM21_98, partial [Acidobacteria bacterium]|nr:hypothetical protein [Acidobacteriota bacterium]